MWQLRPKNTREEGMYRVPKSGCFLMFCFHVFHGVFMAIRPLYASLRTFFHGALRFRDFRVSLDSYIFVIFVFFHGVFVFSMYCHIYVCFTFHGFSWFFMVQCFHDSLDAPFPFQHSPEKKFMVYGHCFFLMKLREHNIHACIPAHPRKFFP